ncbi:MAG: hypothetical protein KDB03_11275 [Planctomycetales bacterium]|nr:hypothetical protein [Planctomycetales bacterium]
MRLREQQSTASFLFNARDWTLLMLAFALTGCHGRAYTDLYVENMASEIRDLEDQLYDYDHEYQGLEQEYISLQSENEYLRKQLNNAQSSRKFGETGTSDGSVGANNANRFPPPSGASALPKTAPDNSPSTEPINIPDELPEISIPGSGAPSPFPPSGTPTKTPRATEPLPLLEIPTIEMGTPSPPRGFSSKEGSQVDDELQLSASRIIVPTMLASQNLNAGATLTLASQRITDRRVVEIAFQPALCRAVNLDAEPDEDGLQLVLQPKNQYGQVILEAVELSIAVLDPERDGDARRIARYDYSAAEVEAKMETLGSNQGIHLTLPWNGPDPKRDRVVVFARYTFPDTRQVIGEMTIFLNLSNSFRTVWTPRGLSNQPDENGVTTASFEVNSNPSSKAWQSNRRVVRPSNPMDSTEPAPSPVR